MLKEKEFLGRIALLLVSTLLSLALAEILLRIIGINQPVGQHHRLFCEHDPLLGWRKIPNATGTHVGPENEYRIRETMNSKGIRGPEYDYNKAENEYRILILGDSFAEGYTVEFEDLFSEVLKRNLNKQQNRFFQVINTGTGGYSTDQELLLFSSEGVKYHPDLTILLFCANDVLYNNQSRYWRGYKPLFQIQDGKLELTNVPVPLPDEPSPAPQSAASDTSNSSSVTERTPLFLRIKRFLYANSYLYRTTRDAIVNTEFLRAWLVKLGLDQPTPDYVRFMLWSGATKAETDAAWEITDVLLLELKKETAGAGSQLLVFIIPGIEEVTQGVIAVCERHNIDFIDPTERFRVEGLKLESQGEQLTFVHDGHWNRHGHELVARILEEYINDKYLGDE